MKTSEIFREARKLLGGRHPPLYICLAITDVPYVCAKRRFRPDVNVDIYPALGVIATRMGRRTGGSVISLEGWLMQQGHVQETPSDEDMRAYRLRWLDALIEEFEAKGD